MSSLYEQWKPAVGDRVRIVERNETGAAVKTGLTGTVVEVHRESPEALCDVQYDARPDRSGGSARQQHAAAELEPIEETAARLDRQSGMPTESAATRDPDWRPTVGDWVVVAAGGRRGVVTAIDERGGGTVCEVEYDHRPGESAEPQRGSHLLSDLAPAREPSAAVLVDEGRG